MRAEPYEILKHPSQVQTLGEWLDHPEGITLGLDGNYYAGGEGGQIYRIDRDGSTQQIADTQGFVLGLAIDGNNDLHVCDLRRKAVLAVTPDGQVRVRSVGTDGCAMHSPNWPVFDAYGNLYVSDSGDYWSREGEGRVFMIDPDGRTTVYHDGPFRFANGMAIDAQGRWLYIAESTAACIVRVPLNEPNGPIEVTHRLPSMHVPDGLAFTANGDLLVACFRPDVVLRCRPDGNVTLLIEDQTSQLLQRPTNLIVEFGRIVVANLGGHHLTAIHCDVEPMVLNYPNLQQTSSTREKVCANASAEQRS